MKITTEMIMSKNPCREWTKEKVQSCICDGKTLLQIAKLKIKIPDIIWCVSHFLSDKQNRNFAIWCARQCETDVPEIKNYINAIEKFYKGKATKEELNAADRAADWAGMQKKQLTKLIEIIKEG